MRPCRETTQARVQNWRSSTFAKKCFYKPKNVSGLKLCHHSTKTFPFTFSLKSVAIRWNLEFENQLLTMKRTISVLPFALSCLIAFNGCKKSEAPAPEQKQTAPPPVTSAPTTPVSAEKNSFQEVTSQLDAGGHVYLYLSTEQWLEGLSGKVSGWRQLIGSLPDLKAEDHEKLDKAFNIVTNLIKSSGIEDVSGFGFSSIAREKGFYHSKAIVHHYKGQGSGFLWSMLGQKPHQLDGLSLLSTNTALAMFGDVDLPLVWSVVKKQVAESGFPQAQQLLDKLPGSFEKSTGLKWEKVLSSLGGEFGVVLTLNDAKSISIPLPGGEPFELPEPALMIVARIKDDTIFNRVDEALNKSGQSVFRTDKPNLKMRSVALPIPLPIQLAPTIATSDGYLFLATTDLIVREALAVKAGEQPGLKTTVEFQRLGKDVPEQGNQFAFVGQRFGETFMQIQRQALSRAAHSSDAQKEWLQSLLSPDRAGFAYTVAGNSDQGWVSVGNGNQHPGKLFLVGAAVPIGMLSAIAIPNFVKARSTAQKNACINNLRQIDGAKQQWALENKKADADAPTKTDLLPYFKDNKFPACPAGGEYTINPMSAHPECSNPGHSL